jgi:hypothetical protein
VHQHLFDLCVTRLGRTTNKSRNLLFAILFQYPIIIIILKCTRSKQARYPAAHAKLLRRPRYLPSYYNQVTDTHTYTHIIYIYIYIYNSNLNSVETRFKYRFSSASHQLFTRQNTCS